MKLALVLVLGQGIGATVLLAQQQGALEEFWVDLVLRLGFPVVVVLMLVKGWLVPGFIYDRVVKNNERLTTIFEDKALPALIKSNDVLDKSYDAWERVLPIIEALTDPPPPRPRRRTPG